MAFKEKNNELKLGVKLDFSTKLMMASVADAKSIVGLVNSEHYNSNAVLLVNEREMEGYIARGWVAVAKNKEGDVVGCQGLIPWPNCGWYEFRFAVVDEAYRGQSISFKLKTMLMDKVVAGNPDAVVIGLKNASSNGFGILESLGLEYVPESDIPTHVKREVLTLGSDQEWKWYVYGYQKGFLASLVRE
jgi:N-acetylglutamate synthase-like GNAT family acetyltransferase